MRTLSVLSLVVALGLLGVAGCGGGNPATVNGTVTYNGQPLETGTVAFYPVDGGPAAYANIQSDGTFRASTGQQKGLALGEYRISVQATGPMPEPGPQNDWEPVPESLIPESYNSPETSGLTATITPGENQVDLELVSQ